MVQDWCPSCLDFKFHPQPKAFRIARAGRAGRRTKERKFLLRFPKKSEMFQNYQPDNLRALLTRAKRGRRAKERLLKLFTK